MKHNAFARNHPTLYRVWGDEDHVPSTVIPDGTPVFVCWSPHLKQWVMSITTLDYRYDALVTDHYFVHDRTLTIDDMPEPAETYYLNKIRSKKGLHDA